MNEIARHIQWIEYHADRIHKRAKEKRPLPAPPWLRQNLIAVIGKLELTRKLLSK